METARLGMAKDALGALGRFEVFPIPQEHSQVRLAWDHVRSVVTARPYTVYAYESHEFRTRLRYLLRAERFDLAHVDSLDLSGYFPVLDRMPFVCVHHDVQSHLLRRRAARQESPARRAYIVLQARLMEREERRWLPEIPLSLAVSDVDRARLLASSPAAKIVVAPNGVDIEYFTPRMEGGTGLVFVGGSSWFPNLDGMTWFGREVVPELARIGVTVPIQWVGRTTPDETVTFRAQFGIELVGHQDDIRPSVAMAGCCIVPLRIGGGTRIKILDAWAMGKAVVSTTIGCEGLDARDGENMLIRDGARDFAEAVESVLADPALRRRLGEAGRRTVEEHYSWDAIGREMNREYLTLIGT